MSYSKTPPNHCGDFKIQNIELPHVFNVATRSIEDGDEIKWRFLNGDTLIDETTMRRDWLFGPEITFDDEPAVDSTAFAFAENMKAARPYEPSRYAMSLPWDVVSNVASKAARERDLFERAFFAALQGFSANPAFSEIDEKTVATMAMSQAKVAVKVLSEPIDSSPGASP